MKLTITNPPVLETDPMVIIRTSLPIDYFAPAGGDGILVNPELLKR